MIEQWKLPQVIPREMRLVAEISSLKGWPALEQHTQGSGEITVLGAFKKLADVAFRNMV